METNIYQQIFEGTGDAIIAADANGLITLWNGGAAAMFGFSAEEAVGQSLDIIIPEKQRARHWEGYDRVIQTGVTKYSTSLLAVPAMRKDGARISVEFTIVMLRDTASAVVGFAAVMRDVTARWEEMRRLRAVATAGGEQAAG